jgi:hypothetical protein
MSGLLNKNTSTKLIFFAVDDDSFLPTKNDMQHHFPGCSFNVYKSWGHFKDCFELIETLFEIKKEGISVAKKYRPEKTITHAYRIDTDHKPNDFFLLKFNTSLVGLFDITEDHLMELSKLIKYCSAQCELMEEMKDVVSKFETGKKAISLLNVDDKTMSNPNQRYINTLFNNYGQKAAKDLVKKLIKWQEKIEWR